MSEPVVAREPAEIEVALWADQLGVELNPAIRDPIVRALMAGRLAFDSTTEEFTYRLRKPIALENGKSIEVFGIREPNAGQIRDSSRTTKDETEQSLRLLSFITGQPLGVIERIGQKDLMVAGSLFAFFG